MIRDPRSNIRSLLNRISVPGNLPRVDDDVARAIPPDWRAVFDASLWNLPDGNKSIPWKAFFEENLERIEDICGGEMADLGYIK